MLRISFAFVALVGLLAGVACGYRPLHQGQVSRARSLHVARFRDRGVEDPTIAGALRRKLLLAFAGRGFKLASASQAAAQLRGVIYPLGHQVIAVRAGRTVGERLGLVLEAHLATRDGRTVWRSGPVELHEQLPVADAVASAETAKRVAVAALAERAADRVVGAIVASRW